MARKKSGTSLEDIANQLAISKNAVSLALNGRPGVSEELRTRVLATASDLNYAGLPRTIRRAGLNFLALTIEQARAEGQIHNNIMWGVESGLKELGHRVMIASISPLMISQGVLPPIFKSFSFSGFLLIGPFTAAFVRTLRDMKLPIVLVDNQLLELPIHSVTPDDHEAAWQLTNHLVQRGCRRIQFVGDVLGRSVYWERWSGCERAQRMAGLDCLPPWPAHDWTSLVGMFDQMPQLPDALVGVNDELALMILQILRSRGIQVPQQVAVVGIDDIQAAHLTSPQLSTYRIPWVEMGREAAAMISSLSGAEHRPMAPVNRRLFGSLQIRESSGGNSHVG
jgi:DNA-binding LacI/PurR family transcriptional regulator